MKKLALTFATAVLAGAGAALAQPAASDVGSGSAERQEGEIRGIVVSSKTGEPLRSAQIALRRQVSGPRQRPGQQHTSSSLDGRFSFSGLASGKYSLYASKTGYETRRRFETVAQVSLGEGESRKGLRIELRPSAVVTGRVLDSYGEPVPGARVIAFRRSHRPEGGPWNPVGWAQTNDLGEYRLFGLAAGRYVVAVQPSAGVSPPGVRYYEHTATYYPGVESAGEAVFLRAPWGAELSGVDFRLAAAPPTSVAGAVFDGDTGGPCRECYLTIRSSDQTRVDSVTPTAQGLFSLRGLAPGAYLLAASIRGDRQRFARHELIVTESPLEDLELVLTSGQTVTGEVVLLDPPEDEAADSGGGRRPLFVRLVSKTAYGLGHLRMWPASLPPAGGEFEIQGVAPDSYRVTVGYTLQGGYLKAVKLSGRRQEKPVITVASDSPLATLKLEIGFDGATVTGTVRPPESWPDDEASPEGVIKAIPDEPGGYLTERFVHFGAGGSFTIQGLVPGAYTLFAVPDRNTFDLWDPQVQRVLGSCAEQVRLSAEDEATVELTFIPEPDQPL